MTVLICNNCKSVRYLAGIFDEDIKNQYTCNNCSSRDILAIDEYSDSIPNEYNVVIQRLKIDKLQKEFDTLKDTISKYIENTGDILLNIRDDINWLNRKTNKKSEFERTFNIKGQIRKELLTSLESSDIKGENIRRIILRGYPNNWEYFAIYEHSERYFPIYINTEELRIIMGKLEKIADKDFFDDIRKSR